jgi:uridine kinase
LIVDKISAEIIAHRNTSKLTIVSICGAADLGKSYLSKNISKELNNKNLKVNHLTMDSYLMDRKIRTEKGLSGYNIEAYNLAESFKDLTNLKNGESIDFYPYDHKTGKKSLNSVKIDSSDILIFDGLHSMHSSFIPHIDITFFLYTNDDFLKKIRVEADLKKRNYTTEFSKSISENEFYLYKTKVEPYKKNADYILYLKEKWNYQLK